MSDIRLDTDTGDILIRNGLLELTDKDDEVEQHLSQRFKMFKGEWFLDLLRGIPFFEKIFIKNPNVKTLDGIYTETILTTPGMTKLTSLELDFDSPNRSLKVTFEGLKVDGVVQYSEIIKAGEG